MNWLDLFDDTAELDRQYYRENARRELSGPCDDDVEMTCPFVGMLPEETDHEDPSPLSF